MPSDPVKAVFWFMHWFLRVLVRFFYILILGAVIYESIINGVVGSIGTLLVGLGVWGDSQRSYSCLISLPASQGLFQK